MNESDDVSSSKMWNPAARDSYMRTSPEIESNEFNIHSDDSN